MNSKPLIKGKKKKKICRPDDFPKVSWKLLDTNFPNRSANSNLRNSVKDRCFNSYYLLKSISVSLAQEIVSSFISVFQVRVQHEIQAIVKFSKIDLIFRIFFVIVFFFPFSSFCGLRRITDYIFRIVFLTNSEYIFSVTIESLEVQDVFWIIRCWSLR